MTILSLKNTKQFDLVKKYGVKKYSSYFLLILAKNFTHIPSKRPNDSFFGMKVSKKISKKAVIRNKIKRKIRHLVRNLAQKESININNKAFIIIPKRNFQNASFADLNKDFLNIFFDYSKLS